MRRLVVAVALSAVLASAAACVAYASANSAWYWTPGMCKSSLTNYGVQIGDGRAFHVQRAFCVGMHNHCWQQGGLRRYKVFIAVMRSYDGNVREMQLTVTGKNSWSGGKLKIIDQFMSADAFANEYGTAAWTVARAENGASCFDIHP